MKSKFHRRVYSAAIELHLPSLVAFVFSKILRIHDILYRFSLKTNGTVKAVKWFVRHSELNSIFKCIPEQETKILNETSELLQRKFTFLGCDVDYSNRQIKWHLDSKSGFKWKNSYYRSLRPLLSKQGNGDCKLPWELSRFQHLFFFVKGYYLSRRNEYVAETVRQIDHWVEENPYCYGVNWTCTMEVSLRCCNWIWAWWAFKDNPEWSDGFDRKFLKSIWQHGLFIEHNLENKGKVRTNHYLSNVVGLLFIGIMFPQFNISSRWRIFGVRELVLCMKTMVYADGVTFEHAIAYHRLALELFAYSAILCKRNAIDLPSSFWNRLEKMFEFTLYSMSTNGRIPMIGDSDDGRFFIFSDYYNWDRWDYRYLLAIGAVLFKRGDFKAKSDRFREDSLFLVGKDGRKVYNDIINQKYLPASKAFQEGGFYILENPQMKCIIRCAPLHDNSFAWHAHCDTLSLVLYVKGQPVIVDPGTYNYTGHPQWRNKFRSTEYHNTIRIDKREMFEMPKDDLFVLKSSQAPPKLITWQVSEAQTVFEGEHYWFSTSKETIIHRRRVVLDEATKSLTLFDSILDGDQHDIEYFLHFHPNISLKLHGDDLYLYSEQNKPICRIGFEKVKALEILTGWYSEEYNKKVRADVLLLKPSSSTIKTTISI